MRAGSTKRRPAPARPPPTGPACAPRWTTSAGDTLVVWKLDRLGRSVKDVLTIADDLHQRGIGVRILTGTLSGSYSPAGEGKFFFTMMAAFAELERDIIHERPWPAWPQHGHRAAAAGGPSVDGRRQVAAAQARRERGETPPRSPRPSASAGRRYTVICPPLKVSARRHRDAAGRLRAARRELAGVSVTPDRTGNGCAGFVGHSGFSTRFSGSRRLPEIAIGARRAGV